jgi:putative methionine-R-sulfoxide reductase with GAF domain
VHALGWKKPLDFRLPAHSSPLGIQRVGKRAQFGRNLKALNQISAYTAQIVNFFNPRLSSLLCTYFQEIDWQGFLRLNQVE